MPPPPPPPFSHNCTHSRTPNSLSLPPEPWGPPFARVCCWVFFLVCVCLHGVCVPFSLTGGVSANFFAVAARPLAMAWFFTPTLWLLSSTLLGTSTRAETQTSQSVQQNSSPALKHKHPYQYRGTLHLCWNTNTPISTAKLSTYAETQTPQSVQRNSPPMLKHKHPNQYSETLHLRWKTCSCVLERGPCTWNNARKKTMFITGRNLKLPSMGMQSTTWLEWLQTECPKQSQAARNVCMRSKDLSSVFLSVCLFVLWLTVSPFGFQLSSFSCTLAVFPPRCSLSDSSKDGYTAHTKKCCIVLFFWAWGWYSLLVCVCVCACMHACVHVSWGGGEGGGHLLLDFLRHG